MKTLAEYGILGAQKPNEPAPITLFYAAPPPRQSALTPAWAAGTGRVSYAGPGRGGSDAGGIARTGWRRGSRCGEQR